MSEEIQVPAPTPVANPFLEPGAKPAGKPRAPRKREDIARVKVLPVATSGTASNAGVEESKFSLGAGIDALTDAREKLYFKGAEVVFDAAMPETEATGMVVESPKPGKRFKYEYQRLRAERLGKAAK